MLVARTLVPLVAVTEGWVSVLCDASLLHCDGSSVGHFLNYHVIAFLHTHHHTSQYGSIVGSLVFIARLPPQLGAATEGWVTMPCFANDPYCGGSSIGHLLNCHVIYSLAMHLHTS